MNDKTLTYNHWITSYLGEPKGSRIKATSPLEGALIQTSKQLHVPE